MLIFAAGCINTEAEKPVSGGVPGRASGGAPDFEIQDINGRNIKLSDYSGRVILLNFFATWCPPCRAEMPDFNEIASEYRGRVMIIAVNVGNESLDTVRAFVNSNRLGFPVALDDGNASRLYGPIRAIPVTVLIGRDFKIAKRYIGARSKEVFVNDIEALQ
jgi:thiol-disulfide isomerase/thioredoxin